MDGTLKPLGDRLPAFWQDSVPLVAETRRTQYCRETVKCAVANKCFFAGAGTPLEATLVSSIPIARSLVPAPLDQPSNSQKDHRLPR